MKMLLLVGLSLLLACGTAATPEDPVWGKEPCAHCAMLVGGKATSAQAIDAKGDRRFFDDIGCLVSWTGQQKAAPTSTWVFGPHGWQDAHSAHYTGGAATPMDFGYVATEAKNGLDYDAMARTIQSKHKQ